MADTEIRLTDQVQDILPVANGGTGASSITGAGIVDTSSAQTLMNKTFDVASNTFQAAAQTYVPSWTASTTNPSIGNGTIQGNYFQFGKLVLVMIALNMGSTTTYGSGYWKISLPVTAASTGKTGQSYGVFECTTHSGSSQGFSVASAYTYTTTDMAFEVANNTRANVSSGAPQSWANGDTFYGYFIYVAA